MAEKVFVVLEDWEDYTHHDSPYFEHFITVCKSLESAKEFIRGLISIEDYANSQIEDNPENLCSYRDEKGETKRELYLVTGVSNVSGGIYRFYVEERELQ